MHKYLCSTSLKECTCGQVFRGKKILNLSTLHKILGCFIHTILWSGTRKFILTSCISEFAYWSWKIDKVLIWISMPAKSMIGWRWLDCLRTIISCSSNTYTLLAKVYYFLSSFKSDFLRKPSTHSLNFLPLAIHCITRTSTIHVSIVIHSLALLYLASSAKKKRYKRFSILTSK